MMAAPGDPEAIRPANPTLCLIPQNATSPLPGALSWNGSLRDLLLQLGSSQGQPDPGAAHSQPGKANELLLVLFLNKNKVPMSDPCLFRLAYPRVQTGQRPPPPDPQMTLK